MTTTKTAAPLHYVPNCNATVTVTACGGWINTLKDYYTTAMDRATCPACVAQIAAEDAERQVEFADGTEGQVGADGWQS